MNEYPHCGPWFIAFMAAALVVLGLLAAGLLGLMLYSAVAAVLGRGLTLESTIGGGVVFLLIGLTLLFRYRMR